MATTRGIACSGVAMAALALFATPAYGQRVPANQAVVLTGGFADHVEPVQGGRIDWANGYILAEGVGRARDRSDQQRPMAQRAAEVVAARNALAMAKGIRINSTACVGGVRDGVVHVQGVIRGHEVVETKWEPNADPPRCKVTLRVPLWGVRGVASVFCYPQRARLRQTAVRRIMLTGKRVAVSDFVLVLDARGLDVSMCLFPEIVDTAGRVLYDLATLPPPTAMQVPLARYVESDLTFERLQAMVAFDELSCFMLARYQPGQRAVTKPANEKGATRPASQPAAGTKRRARRRMAVRVVKTAGPQKTQLVLTRTDAERLRNSPESATAMSKAQVLIVVDAAAAGTEGRRPLPLVESLAAARAPE